MFDGNTNWATVAFAAVALTHSLASTAALVIVYLAQIRAGLPLTTPPALAPTVKP